MFIFKFMDKNIGTLSLLISPVLRTPSLSSLTLLSLSCDYPWTADPCLASNLLANCMIYSIIGFSLCLSCQSIAISKIISTISLAWALARRLCFQISARKSCNPKSFSRAVSYSQVSLVRLCFNIYFIRNDVFKFMIYYFCNYIVSSSSWICLCRY